MADEVAQLKQTVEALQKQVTRLDGAPCLAACLKKD